MNGPALKVLLLHESELVELLGHVHQLRLDVQLRAGHDAERGHRTPAGHGRVEIGVLELADADQVGPVDALDLPGEVRVPLLDGRQWWRRQRWW